MPIIVFFPVVLKQQEIIIFGPVTFLVVGVVFGSAIHELCYKRCSLFTGLYTASFDVGLIHITSPTKQKMGNLQEKLKETQDANNKEATHQLESLQKIVTNKLSAVSAEMKASAKDNNELPIVAIVDTMKKYHIEAKSVPDSKIQESLNSILKGDFISGLVGIISIALNEFLGNTSIGETEEEYCNVAFANNSVLRIDYMFYKYQFSSTGIKDIAENVFCYYVQVSVLDMRKMNPQILLFELTKSLGHDNVDQAVSRLKEIAGFAKNLSQIIDDLSAHESITTGEEKKKSEEGEGKTQPEEYKANEDRANKEPEEEATKEPSGKYPAQLEAIATDLPQTTQICTQSAKPKELKPGHLKHETKKAGLAHRKDMKNGTRIK